LYNNILGDKMSKTVTTVTSTDDKGNTVTTTTVTETVSSSKNDDGMVTVSNDSYGNPVTIRKDSNEYASLLGHWGH
jgi:hypothetical protein